MHYKKRWPIKFNFKSHFSLFKIPDRTGGEENKLTKISYKPQKFHFIHLLANIIYIIRCYTHTITVYIYCHIFWHNSTTNYSYKKHNTLSVAFLMYMPNYIKSSRR